MPRFSGDGAVTKILLYPIARAPEIERPKDADFPRPLDAVKATVLLRVFSEAASRNVITARAWSRVLHFLTNAPAGYKDFLKLSNLIVSFSTCIKRQHVSRGSFSSDKVFLNLKKSLISRHTDIIDEEKLYHVSEVGQTISNVIKGYILGTIGFWTSVLNLNLKLRLKSLTS